MINNYANAFTEVYEILNCLEDDEYDKIPIDVINAITNNRNKDYIFEVNKDIKLQEQNLLNETKAILYNIYRDYLADEEERKEIIKMQKKERLENEEKKRKTYNVNVFESRRKKIEEKEERDDNTSKELYENLQMTEYKEYFINKIINKIKKMFKN